MKHVTFAAHVERRFAPTALMLGNPLPALRRFLGRVEDFGAVHRVDADRGDRLGVSAGIYPLMAISVAIRGLGFASTNSMQQVRLVGTAPALASASVSLNTSVLYIGQAAGSAIGGFLYARDLIYASGYVSAAFIALALVTVILTTQRKAQGV